MKQFKTLFFVFLILAKTTCGQMTDASFQQYCDFRGQYTHNNVDESTTNIQGHTCVVRTPLPARDITEAEYHCKRWSPYILIKSEVDGNRAKCTFENVYHCKSGYTQIRGMCYKDMGPELKTYSEAEAMCKAEGPNAHVFKLHEFHLAEMMEDVMDRLTMYFLAPDKGLEDVHTFVNSTGKHYVILFTYAIHYQAGTYSIVKFKENQKAFVMCAYQPPETILSFKYKAQKLGLLYHPTMLSGVTTVWRTANMYTRTALPNDGKDVCERSMAALTGTTDGTLFNLDPKYSALFTDEIRKSFVVAFGPFEHCKYNSDTVGRVYFKHKFLDKNAACDTQANIIAKNYKADWRRTESFRDQYSFVYYPKTAGTLDMERRRGALYGPMLCGIHMLLDVHQPDCDGWVLYERADRYVCHKYFVSNSHNYHKAKKACHDMGATLGMWTSIDEFRVLVRMENANGGDAWVACFSTNGCSSEEWNSSDGPDLRGRDYMETWHLDGKQNYICTKNP